MLVNIKNGKMNTIFNYISINQFRLRATIVFIVSLIAVNYGNAQNVSESEVKTSMEKFLTHATYQGLEKNALSTELVHTLLNDNELWVGKCPICDQVRRGFRLYVKKEQPSATKKLDKKILKGLKGKTFEKRKAALKLLVDKYVQQYFVALDMSEEERKVMEEKLKEGRKTGMERASGGEGFYCSSCDGACHVSTSSEEKE